MNRFQAGDVKQVSFTETCFFMPEQLRGKQCREVLWRGAG